MDDMLYLGCEGEIQQLLQGPRDETDIYKCLAGTKFSKSVFCFQSLHDNQPCS